jgi:hypothetical protein
MTDPSTSAQTTLGFSERFKLSPCIRDFYRKEYQLSSPHLIVRYEIALTESSTVSLLPFEYGQSKTPFATNGPSESPCKFRLFRKLKRLSKLGESSRHAMPPHLFTLCNPTFPAPTTVMGVKSPPTRNLVLKQSNLVAIATRRGAVYLSQLTFLPYVSRVSSRVLGI